MIITCPNCSTPYTISAGVLDASGRTVRCSRCGTQWLQTAARDSQAAPVRRQPRPEPSTAFYEPPPARPAPAPKPRREPAPRPSDDLVQARVETAEPARPVQPAPQPKPKPAPVPEPVRQPVDDMDGPSEEELETLFGEEPGTMDSFVGNVDDDDDDDDIDSEPIPEVFTQFRVPRDEPAKEGNALRWFLTFAIPLLILGALIAGAHFGRETIVVYWPPAEQIYRQIDTVADKLGFPTEKAGVGLEIRITKSERINKDEGLNIMGVVANITDTTQPVPRIKVVLRDEQGVEVQSMMLDPVKTELPAAEEIPFEARIELLHPTVRKMEVTFTEAAAETAEGGAAAHGAGGG